MLGKKLWWPTPAAYCCSCIEWLAITTYCKVKATTGCRQAGQGRQADSLVDKSMRPAALMTPRDGFIKRAGWAPAFTLTPFPWTGGPRFTTSSGNLPLVLLLEQWSGRFLGIIIGWDDPSICKCNRGYMWASSGSLLLNWGIFYRFL